MRQYFVYLLASRSRTLYVGVTNDLRRRIAEHRRGVGSNFSRRYRATNLVFFETTSDVRVAIRREKQLKRWPRWRKVRLIETGNPAWDDLAADEESWRT